jgi:5'-deoxynucleotidase
MPTPIKYYNPAIRDAYKQVEQVACDKLLGMLPEKLRPTYEELLTPADEEVEQLVKAADKLSAWIKCIEELKAGNLEFRAAAEQTEKALDACHMPEVEFFKEHFMPSFRLTLDELE